MTDALAGRRFWLAVIAVLVFAGALRFAGLGRWPFASDEIGSFDDVGRYHNPPHPITHPDQALPSYLPVSMVTLDAGHRLFGRDEFGCRVLVALVGVAHIAVVMVGLSGVFPRAVALTAGGWLAVSVEHIFYSQYHRFYTLAALLVGCAVLTASRSVKLGSVRWMVLAVVFAGLAVLAHTLTGLVFGILLLGAAFGRKKWPAVVAVVGAVGAVAWLKFVIMPAIGSKAGLTAWIGHTPAHALFGAAAQASWPVCVLALIGAAVLWQRDRAQAAFWAGAAAVWVGAALGLPLVLQYHSAYIFPFVLAVFVLAAVAVAEIASAVRAKAGPAAAWFVWLGLPLLNLPALASYYQDGNRHDFRAAAAYLVEHVGPNDRILSNEPDKLARYRPELVPHILPVPRSIDPQDALALVPSGGRLWVVCSGGRSGFEPAWQGWVQRNCLQQTVVARTRYDYYAFPVWVFRCGPVTE